MKKFFIISAILFVIYKLMRLDPVLRGIIDRIKLLILFNNPLAQKELFERQKR